MVWAEKIAESPQLWESLAKAYRTTNIFQSYASSGVRRRLLDAFGSPEAFAPEPIGFVAGALILEVIRSQGERSLIRDAARRVLQEPCFDPRLESIRKHVCAVLEQAEAGSQPDLDGGRNASLELGIQRLESLIHSGVEFVEGTLSWGLDQYRQGRAYQARAQGDPADNLMRAIACYESAGEILRRHFPTQDDQERAYLFGDPDYPGHNFLGIDFIGTQPWQIQVWAQVKRRLAEAHYEMARLAPPRSGDHHVQRSVECSMMALNALDTDDKPLDWAKTQLGLAAGTYVLAQRHPPGPARQECLERCARASQEACTTFERMRIDRGLILALDTHGRAEMDLGHWEAATQSYERAAEFIEKELGEVGTATGRAAWLHEQPPVYVGLVSSWVQVAISGGQPGAVARAAYWAERSRARILADFMNAVDRPPRGVSDEEYARYRALIHSLRDHDHRIQALQRQRDGDRSIRALQGQSVIGGEANQEEFAGLLDWQRNHGPLINRQVTELRHQFAECDPDWAPSAAPLEPDDLRAVARRAEAALVTLDTTPRGTVALAILPDGRIESTLLKSIQCDELRRLMTRGEDGNPLSGWIMSYGQYCQAVADGMGAFAEYRRGRMTLLQFESYLAIVKARESEWWYTLNENLGQLGALLWQPLRAWLAGVYPPATGSGQPHPLVLMPGEILNVLPLHAAWWVEGGHRRWACDEYQISYAPSVWVLHRCLARQEDCSPGPHRLLAVRNPTGDLAWADWEVDQVARLFPAGMRSILGNGLDAEAATRTHLLRRLRDHSVALLSTHCTYSHSDPWNGSRISLDPRETDDESFAAVDDLFGADVRAMWLVVLSACESGLAYPFDRAGEQLGMPAAFLAAGAATVVGSLWSVKELPTALLIARFFEELFGPDGQPRTTKAHALWLAQRWLRSLTRSEAVARMDSVAQEQQAGSRPPSPTRVLEEKQIIEGGGEYPFAHPACWAAFGCHGAL